MKRAFFIIPFVALFLFALGIARELSDRDDEIEHFQLAPEDVLHLDFREPFGTSVLTGTLTGSNGETLEDGVLYIGANDTPFWNRSDAAGHFELKQLPAGPWRALVVARGYQPQTFEVADDGTARTLVLQTPIETIPDLPQRATGDLTGKLIDPNVTDADFSGYEISLRADAPLEDPRTPFPRRVLADASGKFELPEFSEGRYRVRVFPPWARGGIWPDLCAAESHEFVFDPESNTTEFAVSIERGEVHGRLTDSKGSFLEGALVILESVEDRRRAWPPVSTSREGSFLITDLPPGSYRIRARAGAGETEQRVEVRAGLTLNLDLDPLVTRDPEKNTANE